MLLRARVLLLHPATRVMASVSSPKRVRSGSTSTLLGPHIVEATAAFLSSSTAHLTANPAATDLVVYHGQSCPDGFAAAWVAHTAVPNAVFFPAAHGAGPPAVPDVAGKHVAVIDFCYSGATTQALIEQAASFVVLDHHASAEKELAGIAAPYKVFEMKQSGCTLAWDFFYPGKPAPLFLRYLEDKDIWRWGLRDSREFTAGYALRPSTFESLDALAAQGDAGVAAVIESGRQVLAYRDGVVASHARRAVPARLNAAPGFQVMLVNGTTLASEIGNVLAQEEGIDIGMIIEWETGGWRVSLRSDSDDVDVSVIAKSLGGGGHRRASGFSIKGAIEPLLAEGGVVPGREALVAAAQAKWAQKRS